MTTPAPIPSSRRTREELQFLPALVELVETPASPTAHATALVLCLFIGLAILWACLAQLDLVAVMDGRIVPAGRAVLIQAAESARVRRILADDNDRVAAGQVLVEFEADELRAALEGLRQTRARALVDAEEGRSLLDESGTEQPLEPGIDPALVAAMRRSVAAQKDKLRAAVEGLRADLRERAILIEGALIRKDRASQTLDISRVRYEVARDLARTGNGTAEQMRDAQTRVIDWDAEWRGLDQTIAQYRAQGAAIEARIAEAVAGVRATASDLRAKSLSKVGEIDQQVAETTARLRARRLVAPVAGLISGKQVFSTGAVVGAGATLMTIIPDDQPLEVEAEVANADIGFVTEGQTVALKLDAFPFTRYGLLKGHIRSLNRDASDPAHDQGRTNGNGAPQFTFAARISIDEGAPSDRIRTGMRVRAEAKTGRQSVASYLLSPLRRTLAEAGRER